MTQNQVVKLQCFQFEDGFTAWHRTKWEPLDVNKQQIWHFLGCLFVPKNNISKKVTGRAISICHLNSNISGDGAYRSGLCEIG